MIFCQIFRFGVFYFDPQFVKIEIRENLAYRLPGNRRVLGDEYPLHLLYDPPFIELNIAGCNFNIVHIL
jgi:hypothetical protein